MKKVIFIIIIFCIPFLSFSQTEIVKFKYSANGERIERKVIILDGNDSNKTKEELILFSDHEKNIKVFPNPVASYLKIEINGYDIIQSLEYQILTLEGSLVRSGTLNSGDEIQLDQLPTGVYFFTLFINSERKAWKIIKK